MKLQNWVDKYAKLTLKTRIYSGYADVMRLHSNPILQDYITIGAGKDYLNLLK